MNVSQIDVSIITPVYNTSPIFLQQYIDSIFAFDQFAFEVILVNDGSSMDNTSVWLDNTANENPNIILIKNERNQGISVCRNMALDRASGEYIVILDSDDYLYPNTLWRMLQKARKENADIVLAGYRWVTEDNKVIKDFNLAKGSTGNAFVPYSVPTTSRLLRKRIIDQNNIRYPNHSYLEDSCFNIWCIAVAKKISMINAISFCNREHTFRTSHQRKNFNAMSYEKIPLGYIEKMLKNVINSGQGQQISFLGEMLCLMTSICCIFTLYAEEKERRKIVREVSDIIKKYFSRPFRTSLKYLFCGKSGLAIRMLQVGFSAAITLRLEFIYIKIISRIIITLERRWCSL